MSPTRDGVNWFYANLQVLLVFFSTGTFGLHMAALNAVSALLVSFWLLKPYSIQIQNLLEKKFLVQLTEICADVLDINKLSIQ